MPIGNNQIPVGALTPAPYKAIATAVSDITPTVSSILILTHNTTAIEVTATGGPAYIRWLSQNVVDSSVAGTSVIATGATANFDHVIPNATVRRFVVPVAIEPTSSTSVMGANRANGLYSHMAYAGATASIIAVTQYGSSNSY